MNNMTSGSPLKILITFSLPMLLSMVFQQLYSVIDSIIAGNFIGVDGLAATGASYPITTLFIAVATGASVGSSVVISQFFGAKLMERVKSAIYTAIITLFVLALVLTGIGLLSCNFLLSVIGTPENIFADSSAYLRIYVCGLVFLFLYNAATSIYNGLGDSRMPLCFLVFSSVLNVILDILFVSTFSMGVAGLAWATFLAQGISALLSIGTLIVRIRKISVNGRVPLWNRGLLVNMMYIAIPSICQQSFVSIGVFLVQGVVNSFGSDTVAAFSAALKISTFALMVMNTMPNALSNFASQNIGAHELERVRQGLRISIVIAMIVIAGVNLLFLCAASQILGLFIPNGGSRTVIHIGVQFLHTIAPFYFLVGIKNCCDSVLRGGGAMKPFMATTFSDLIIRIAFSFLFAGALGFTSICWAYPVGWIFGTLLSIRYYRTGVWRTHIPEPHAMKSLVHKNA